MSLLSAAMEADKFIHTLPTTPETQRVCNLLVEAIGPDQEKLAGLDRLEEVFSDLQEQDNDDVAEWARRNVPALLSALRREYGGNGLS